MRFTGDASLPRLFAWLLVALAAAPLGPAGAQRRGTSPYVTRQRQQGRQVTRARDNPTAMLHLLRMGHAGRHAHPSHAVTELRRIVSSSRVHRAARNYAQVMLARAIVRAGDIDGAARTWDEMGFVRHFRFVGPFDNEGKAGFGTAYPPERDRNAPVNLQAQFQGRARAVRWRTYPDITRFGYVNFDAVMRPFENVCGYAETFVQSTMDRPLALWVGAGGAVKVWFNGVEVISDARYRGPDPDRFVAQVSARRGWNRVLVKACVTSQSWGFYLRLTRAGGEPFGVVRAEPSPRDLSARPPAGPGRGGRQTRSHAAAAALATLEQRAREQPQDAGAQLALAQFLVWTNAEDPDDQPVRALAERACELAPSVEACLFAARLVDERAERFRLLEKAALVAPRDDRVTLLRAALVAGGPEPERAIPILASIRPGSIEGIRAAILHAGMLNDFGFTHSALALLEAAARRAPDANLITRERVRLLNTLDRADDALALNQRIVAVHYSNFAARRALVVDALERGDTEQVLAHTEVMRRVGLDNAGTIDYVGGVFEALGQADNALAAYRSSVEMAPDNAAAHVTLGRAQLRLGQESPAAGSLREALRLRPQDTATRQLLEQIRPSVRADEAYATDSDAILARRRDSSDRPITVLHDLRVASVFDNGLGSSYRQFVAQVHNAEGARRFRSYSIPYEPGTQWPEIRMVRVVRRDGEVLEGFRTSERSLSNPSYRIYYDRRAFIVHFPDLEPGDTVELRYRVDDIAHRNLFNDYFGDLQILQSTDPIARLEYVLITPRSRTVHINRPRLRSLQRQTTTQGDRRIDRFVAENIPPLRAEPRMPGSTEVAPYLHVSTYASWEDLGRWWWGLIREQLNPDDNLRRTVDDLVRGAPDTRTKVRRIYEWVTENTRYVGLEFGIHGFKPYRVTQVVRRGFGDCKDTASLMYAMFLHAGIDARIALVRTRANGAIGQTPASLAVFDHAIAYVPELDLFLDGTVQNGGFTELPAQDQGVTTLLVGPSSTTLRLTPVLPHSAIGSAQTLRIQLEETGAATVEAQETVRGHLAIGYRTRYQAEATQNERLQRRLAGRFPGIEVTHQQFANLDRRDQPVTFTWSGRVPRLAQRSGRGLRARATTLRNLTSLMAARTTRRHALDLASRWMSTEDRTIRLPAGMHARVPQSSTINSPFGQFSLSYTATRGEVRTRTSFALTRARITVQEYPAFRRWLEQVDTVLRQQLRIERTP